MMKGLKIYIAGKITGFDGYRARFLRAEQFLRDQGAFPMHSAGLPQEGFSHSEYLRISFAMIDVCDAVYFMDNCSDSAGALEEFCYATKSRKLLLYEGMMKGKDSVAASFGCEQVEADPSEGAAVDDIDRIESDTADPAWGFDGCEW